VAARAQNPIAQFIKQAVNITHAREGFIARVFVKVCQRPAVLLQLNIRLIANDNIKAAFFLKDLSKVELPRKEWPYSSLAVKLLKLGFDRLPVKSAFV